MNVRDAKTGVVTVVEGERTETVVRAPCRTSEVVKLRGGRREKEKSLGEECKKGNV
jgi:hypothetical protein